jgi:uncharacterized protein (DUF433 family)
MAILIDANPVPQETVDGVLRVTATRVTLDMIIAAFKEAESPAAIAEQFPTVALKSIFSVITCYLRRSGAGECL